MSPGTGDLPIVLQHVLTRLLNIGIYENIVRYYLRNDNFPLRSFVEDVQHFFQSFDDIGIFFLCNIVVSNRIHTAVENVQLDTLLQATLSQISFLNRKIIVLKSGKRINGKLNMKIRTLSIRS